MTCAQTQSLLNAYLDQELSPSERVQVQTHLHSCSLCQHELAQLSALQLSLRSALQHQAALVQVPANAKQRLETRLWSNSPLPHPVHGGTLVRKPFLLGAAVVVLLLALVGVWISQNAKPVSAQEILTRSAQSQQTLQTKQGIQHTQTKLYFNPHAFPPSKPVSGEPRTTLMDSYRDLQTGTYRTIARNVDTQAMTDAFGFDGVNLYTAKHDDGVDAVTVLYRTPQGEGVAEIIKKEQIEATNNATQSEATLGDSNQQLFDKMRNDPANTSVTQETWEDGRTVYMLKQPVPQNPDSPDDVKKAALAVSSVLYFDTKTYALLGQASFTEQDRQAVIFYSSRIVLDEILPADTHVAWDMTDLSGVKIVDDPNGEFGDQLPAPITADELVKRTKHVYLLNAVPEGFTLQITAPPHPHPDEPDIYIADYRDANDSYFVIQGGMSGPLDVTQQPDRYITRSGFKLYFDFKRAPEEGYATAAVVAPDGTMFLLSAKLPRERVEQLADTLTLVQ